MQLLSVLLVEAPVVILVHLIKQNSSGFCSARAITSALERLDLLEWIGLM